MRSWERKGESISTCLHFKLNLLECGDSDGQKSEKDLIVVYQHNAL